VAKVSIAEIEHVETGEQVETDGEIPFGAIYKAEGYDKYADKAYDEERIRLDDGEYIVIDNGVDIVSLGE